MNLILGKFPTRASVVRRPKSVHLDSLTWATGVKSIQRLCAHRGPFSESKGTRFYPTIGSD